MDANMQCRGMQYEVGKSYQVDGDIVACKNGLHFCEHLKNVFDFYPRENGNRFFEVEAFGTIVRDGKKIAASDIKIVRELSQTEINRAAYGNGYGYGHGYGDGDGNGDGYGNGYGHGDGNGDGNGYGYENIQRILEFA